MQLIRLQDIEKTYTLGEVEVRACKASPLRSVAASTWR